MTTGTKHGMKAFMEAYLGSNCIKVEDYKRIPKPRKCIICNNPTFKAWSISGQNEIYKTHASAEVLLCKRCYEYSKEIDRKQKILSLSTILTALIVFAINCVIFLYFNLFGKVCLIVPISVFVSVLVVNKLLLRKFLREINKEYYINNNVWIDFMDPVSPRICGTNSSYFRELEKLRKDYYGHIGSEI